MPPQQSNGPLDLIDDGLDFGAHGFTSIEDSEGEPNGRTG
jgi:hypothetical protein